VPPCVRRGPLKPLAHSPRCRVRSPKSRSRRLGLGFLRGSAWRSTCGTPLTPTFDLRLSSPLWIAFIEHTLIQMLATDDGRRALRLLRKICSEGSVFNGTSLKN